MFKLKFKPSKKKQIKLKFFNTKSFPKRSQKEWKLIDKNPFGDTDGDRVPNWFDCKPLNKKKQGKFSQNIPIDKAKYITFYHGTAKELAKNILKKGLLRPEWVQGYGTNRKIYQDREIYVSPRLSIAKEFAEMRGEQGQEDISGGEILKVNVNRASIKNISGAINAQKNKEDEYVLYENIPKEDIRIMSEKDKNKKLKKEIIIHLDDESPEMLQSLYSEDTNIKPIEIKDED